ncbi:MAG: hypothetical protein ACI9OU_000131, partial [Candidatus Promineifilaceae bacterium]
KMNIVITTLKSDKQAQPRQGRVVGNFRIRVAS